MIKTLGDKIWPFLLLLFVGGCGYVVYKGITYKNPPQKNHKECSFVIYYDTVKHNLSSKYLPSVYYLDSLVSFTDPTGNVWWQKDFLNDEDKQDENNVQYEDVTLKNGKRFKVTDISSGGCQIKAVEDSLFNALINSNDSEDDN